MSYRGDIALGATIDVKFATVAATGAPTTLAGTPAVAAYVDNGTTEITAGITLSVDFDSRTGMHNVRVVATSGNGYATATNVDLVLTAGTVGGTSVVGYVVGSFSIENRSGLRPTTAGRTLDVSAGGEAGVDWANVGSPTTANNLSGTNIKTDQVVASVSGAVGSVTGLTASNLDATISSRLATAGYTTPPTVAQILTTAITEAYRANGAAPTLAQFISEVLAHLGESSISGTTKTINKLDHSTPAETFTLDSAVTPAAISRAT